MPPIIPVVTVPLEDIPIPPEYTQVTATVYIESVRYIAQKGVFNCLNDDTGLNPRTPWGPTKTLERNTTAGERVDYIKWEHPSVDRDIVTSSIVIDLWTDNCSAGTYLVNECTETSGTYNQPSTTGGGACRDQGDFASNYLCRRGVIRVSHDRGFGRQNSGEPLEDRGRVCRTDGMWGGNRLGGLANGDSSIRAHWNAITKVTFVFSNNDIPDYVPFDQSGQWPI